MNWKILVAGGALIVPLVLLLASGFGRDPHALPSAMEGKPAPAFSLLTLEGEPVSLDELRGEPVVLNFWATWCGPCALEHPVLTEGARRYKGRGVVFLGVLYGDDPEKAASFLSRNDSAYPTLVDAQQRTAIDYGVAGVPETFFINREGQIVRKVSGPVSPEVLVGILEGLL